jgi:hypothetical protein
VAEFCATRLRPSTNRSSRTNPRHNYILRHMAKAVSEDREIGVILLGTGFPEVERVPAGWRLQRSIRRHPDEWRPAASPIRLLDRPLLVRDNTQRIHGEREIHMAGKGGVLRANVPDNDILRPPLGVAARGMRDDAAPLGDPSAQTEICSARRPSCPRSRAGRKGMGA